MRGTKKFCGSYERSRQPTRWLELVTADHLVAQNGSMEGITGHCDAIIIKDLFSKVKAFSQFLARLGKRLRMCYTQSPLQDSRLLGPRPWKILAAI